MLGEPFIPDTITVHLGRPDSDARNVTVSFPDYVKNVASSEIYPTWPDNAIRANIYVIVSYALNRIYTEWYRSRGYDFDITNSTQYDQAYVEGRDIFDSISVIVDELFNDYIRKQGSIEPFFAAFCNGTTSTCAGLSQWGTVDLANRGYTPYQILQNYYGDNIDIVMDAPVSINIPSYPDRILRVGDGGDETRTIQVELNRISENYPAIPKIYPVDGVYTVGTENAVRQFQKIFNLPQTGEVDKKTWYKIGYIFTSVKKLAELNSEGINLQESSSQYDEEALQKGQTNNFVKVLQYYLAVIGAYYEAVLPVDITGYFGDDTENSIKSFQQVFGLPQTGIVDRNTWNDLYRAYAGIVENVPVNISGAELVLYPGVILSEGMTSEYIKVLQQYLSLINQVYPDISAVNDTGYFGPITKRSVTEFQRHFGLPESGVVNAATWNEIAGVYSDIKFGYRKQPAQNPGYTIR